VGFSSITERLYHTKSEKEGIRKACETDQNLRHAAANKSLPIVEKTAGLDMFSLGDYIR